MFANAHTYVHAYSNTQQTYMTFFRAKAHLKTFNASRPSSERSFINEDLTETNRKLLGAARKAVSDNLLDSAWSSNCHVYVKALPPDGKRYTITSLQRLYELTGQRS